MKFGHWVWGAVCAGPLALSALARPGLSIDRAPEHVTHRVFDPARPPREMPKIVPPEVAVTSGDSSIDVSVGGSTRETASNRAEVTITNVELRLHLDITVWLPKDAAHAVVEHEEGHRRISERYYENAASVARDVAQPYLGKVIVLTSRNVRGQVHDALGRVSAQIAAEYSHRMPIEATQRRYDEITAHSLNDVAVNAAIDQAFAETQPRSNRSKR